VFLGEAGSTIAGFSLGVLAVISGAKLATAATALAVPLVDIVLVVTGRILRGESPFRGDATHLHFRLLQAGLTPRVAVRLIWMIALVFGLLALTLQTRGKIFLFTGLVFLILAIAVIAYQKSRPTKR
jgi:UDP-GlcNAc:undecaprenyl-phosphate GlcNAc-1-phosphate transferase